MANRHQNILELINNFEKIPRREDYTSALVSRINPDLLEYYSGRDVGWDEFHDDVIFLLDHLDIPLRYVGKHQDIVSNEDYIVCLFWTQVEDRYSVFIARSNQDTVENWIYDTLEAAVGTLLIEIIKIQHDINYNPRVEITEINKEDRLVLDFMHLRNVDRVNIVMDDIKHGYINILKPLTNLSIDPLSSCMDANATLVKDGLVVIGLQGCEIPFIPEDDDEEEEMEPSYQTTPFIVKYRLDDAPLLLTGLFYTRDAYVTLRYK